MVTRTISATTATPPTLGEIPAHLTLSEVSRLKHIHRGENAREWANAVLNPAPDAEDSPPFMKADAAATVIGRWRARPENRRISLDGTDIPKPIHALLGMLHTQIQGEDPVLSARASEALCDASEYSGDPTLVTDLMAEDYPSLARVNAAATVLALSDKQERTSGRQSTPSPESPSARARGVLEELGNSEEPNVRLNVAEAIELRQRNPHRVGDAVWHSGPEYDDFRDACMAGLTRMTEGLASEEDPSQRYRVVQAVLNLANAVVHVEERHHTQVEKALSTVLKADGSMRYADYADEEPIKSFAVRKLIGELKTWLPAEETRANIVHEALGESVDSDADAARVLLTYFREQDYMAAQYMTHHQSYGKPCEVEKPEGEKTLNLIVRAGQNHPELRKAAIQVFRWMLGRGNETDEVRESLGVVDKPSGLQEHGGLAYGQENVAAIIVDYLARLATKSEMGEIAAAVRARGIQGVSDKTAEKIEERRRQMPDTPSAVTQAEVRQPEGGQRTKIDLSDLGI